jgi:hypothetical protein
VTAISAWQAGRFDAGAGPGRILFGQMYEDAEVERRAFRSASRVFCIASAASTALALCDQHDVVACDINPAQLAYAARRLAGGPAEVGAAEKVMRFARHLMPAAGWTRSRVEAFLGFGEVPDQLAFWRANLDTWRFRAGFGAMMSVAGLRTVYTPALLEFLPRHFGAVLRARMLRCFAHHPNVSNPYARALLVGDATAPATEPRNALRVHLVLADAATYLESCSTGSFGAFSLSNILDGALPAYRERLMRAVRGAATKDAWVVARSFGEPYGAMNDNQAEGDRSMLWGIVDVQPVDRWTRPARGVLIEGP